MNRQQFDDRFRNMQLQQAELDRKWRMHLDEQQQMQLLEAAGQRGVASTSSSGAAGVSTVWQTATNTAYLYPISDLEYAIEHTSVVFTREGNRFIFANLSDLDEFYYEVWARTAVTQPVGNLGYTMGVGTKCSGSVNEIYLDLANGTRIITWQLMTQLTPQSANAPEWIGNSPQGTVGYGAIYSDVDGDGVPGLITDPMPTGNLDPLRFFRII